MTIRLVISFGQITIAGMMIIKRDSFSVGKSFHDHLTSQLGLKRLNEKQLAIATTIIGNMDDAGYLRREISSMVDDLSFRKISLQPKEKY